ncbi:MAG: sulfotransferase [Hyphobacterium sp.]|nr:MAG: sulfotransferase [Hyphobacterium sp.]
MSAGLQQGFAALQAGNAQTALEIARAGGADPNAHYLEGLALRALGEAASALAIFERLAAAHPGMADFANLAGLCLADLGRVDDAVRAFEQALTINPKFVHGAFNLGRALAEAGRLEAAILAYRRALEMDASHLPSRRNLAWCLMSHHDLALAEIEADAALEAAPGDPLSLAVKASALIARKAYGEAASLVGARLTADAPPANAALALGKQGEALEKAGDYGAAFDAWADANHRLKSRFSAEFEAQTGGFSLSHVQILRHWPGKSVDDGTPLDGPAPVFLVGFPRSGTTLIENVLAAHPDIETSDEHPLSSPLIEAAGNTPDAWRVFLKSLPERRNDLRRAYWAGWTTGAPPPGQVFIDKLPLNLAFVGVLSAVFPDARFILALRDPRDCVLSAFKQRFGMNAAMYRMLSLDDAAQYYDAVMQAGEAALANVDAGRQTQIRYEDSLADLDGEVRRLIDFLRLEWTDAVMSYREQAKARFISTPSAPQVVQPLYTSSAGRWRDYDFAMADIRPLLDPWAKKWGYEV